jgi:hypothetical protein
MNFNYSYRAFLITCLLFGILFLAFKSINLSKYVIVEEDSFDVEYSKDELLLEEELATLSKLDLKVETNRAFNEAEKFISEIEKENAESQENSNTTRETGEVSDPSNIEGREKKNNKKPSVKEEKWTHSDSESSKINSKKNSSKRNSTVSYSLLNRSVLDLPNPAYTCATSGKIVINIIVSETGKILNATYNKASSTSSNECLIDAALDYAKRANFTTFVGKKEQLGSITYNFPGQR